MGLSVAGEAVGCGGVCRYDDADATAELKAIYVVTAASRSRVRPADRAGTRNPRRAHRLPRLRLETGDAQPEAIALYRSLGYTQIERYGPYRDLVRSVCFERALEP